MLFRFYLLLLLQGLALSNSAKLNGGLAFSEADKNGQIYVNLNRFLATRTADTNILNHISSLGMDIVNRYYAHCNQVSNLLTGYEANKTPKPQNPKTPVNLYFIKFQIINIIIYSKLKMKKRDSKNQYKKKHFEDENSKSYL